MIIIAELNAVSLWVPESCGLISIDGLTKVSGVRSIVVLVCTTKSRRADHKIHRGNDINWNHNVVWVCLRQLATHRHTMLAVVAHVKLPACFLAIRFFVCEVDGAGYWMLGKSEDFPSSNDCLHCSTR